MKLEKYIKKKEKKWKKTKWDEKRGEVSPNKFNIEG